MRKDSALDADEEGVRGTADEGEDFGANLAGEEEGGGWETESEARVQRLPPVVLVAGNYRSGLKKVMVDVDADLEREREEGGHS